MATATRRTAVHNPARKKPKKNRAKKTEKQIKYFGTKAERAALKRSRAAKWNRPRPKARAKAKARKRTITAKPAAKRTAKRNTAGSITHYVIGSAHRNPGEGKMATKKTRKRKNTASHRPASRARHAKRRNGSRTRHNPFGGNWGASITTALFVIAGAIGSKLGAQAVLGTSNTGPMGYAANLAIGGVGAYVIGGPMKNKKGAAEFFSGAVAEVFIRLINDFTPFGSYVSGLGIGDAGVAGLGMGMYKPSNFVTPQHYVDPFNSAMVSIPAGWAPTTVIQSSAPPNGMNNGMGSLYGGGGSSAALY